MRIGVVTATHPKRNGAFLERAARSVWYQSHPVSGHFIANDVDSKGAAWTRQQALDANPYELTAFLDSDDWFMENHIARLYHVMRDTNADYVYSWYHLVHGYVGAERVVPDSVFPVTHFTDPWDPANPRHTTITVLVKTELAKEVGFVSVPDDGEYAARRGEDWEFTLGCNRLGTIYHLAEKTWYWHHHGWNSSGVPGHGDA